MIMPSDLRVSLSCHAPYGPSCVASVHPKERLSFVTSGSKVRIRAPTIKPYE